MNTYPLIPAIRVGSSRTLINPSQRSQSEAGYIFTRKVFTKAKHKYSLNYSNLTNAEFEILENFFKQNVGKKFYFTYPTTNVEVVCTFAIDELVAQDDFRGYCNTKVELIEI